MKRKNRMSRLLWFILIILLVSAACSGFVFLWIKTIASGGTFTSDAWLGFWGSIIGSVVTMLGIILTLSFESKQNNIIRRLEAQPIIILKPLPLFSEHSENESSYDISVSGKDGGKLRFSLPDIQIQNIGLNFATKINLSFSFKSSENCFFSVSFNPLSIIDAKETKQISLDFEISKDIVYDFFSNSHMVKKSGLMHACCATAIASLAQANRKESIDRLEKVSFASGELTTTFEDIYGNAYEQKRTAAIYYAELRDEDPVVFMRFSSFAEAELREQRKKGKR